MNGNAAAVYLWPPPELTPYQLWNQIIEEKNVALAIVVGSIAIAIGLIVAAAIHG